MVSAAVDVAGNTGNITVLSEVGLPCTVLSPWLGAGIKVTSGGSEIAVVKAAGNRRWTFKTAAGSSYKLTASTPSLRT